MSRWHSRQRRRRRRLLLLGLTAAAGAGALWYRSAHGHFPWSAERMAALQRDPVSLIVERDPRPVETIELVPHVPSHAVVVPATRPGESIAVPRLDAPVAAGGDTKAESPPRALQTNVSVPAGPVAPAVAVAATRPTGARPTRPDSDGAVRDFDEGLAALAAGDLARARTLLASAYQAGLSGERARLVREKMADLAGQTIFSPRLVKDDPLTEFVIVRPGETLRAIAGRFTVTEEFIAFVNHVRDKNLLREGQRLKLVHGPFHATVSKPEHVLDLYLRNHYLRSFRVALGVGGSTPSGTWRVANRQEDPGWVDPQTGQRWHPSDPNNPIGEHWIGLTGLEGQCAGRTGYGIHGTIDPVSIGQDVSMGCIRLAPEDAALLYRVLQPGQSYVIVTD